MSTPTLQDARLPCDKRMAYAAVRGGVDAELRLDSLVRRSLNTESAISFFGRKDLDTKTGTLTLQDARLPCNKRMAYAAV